MPTAPALPDLEQAPPGFVAHFDGIASVGTLRLASDRISDPFGVERAVYRLSGFTPEDGTVTYYLDRYFREVREDVDCAQVNCSPLVDYLYGHGGDVPRMGIGFLGKWQRDQGILLEKDGKQVRLPFDLHWTGREWRMDNRETGFKATYASNMWVPDQWGAAKLASIEFAAPLELADVWTMPAPPPDRPWFGNQVMPQQGQPPFPEGRTIDDFVGALENDATVSEALDGGCLARFSLAPPTFTPPVLALLPGSYEQHAWAGTVSGNGQWASFEVVASWTSGQSPNYSLQAGETSPSTLSCAQYKAAPFANVPPAQAIQLVNSMGWSTDRIIHVGFSAFTDRYVFDLILSPAGNANGPLETDLVVIDGYDGGLRRVKTLDSGFD